MKFLIILTLAVAAFALPQGELVHRNRVMPVQDTIEGRITGGKTASVGQFPYQVGLSLRVNALSSAWCGGSLIGPTWVLTAAHCTDGISSLTVYLGATIRTSYEVSRSVSKSDITIHPKWNADTIQNDISLIRIAAVAYSNKIQPVKLPAVSNSYSTYVGQTATASGWGRTSDDATSVSNTLEYVELLVRANSFCRSTYGSASVSDCNICVSTTGGMSTCNGDSGGPLVLNENKEQIALTSYGAKAGCQKNYPAVFTNVPHFRSWILEITSI